MKRLRTNRRLSETINADVWHPAPLLEPRDTLRPISIHGLIHVDTSELQSRLSRGAPVSNVAGRPEGSRSPVFADLAASITRSGGVLWSHMTAVVPAESWLKI
jgi:hypothetical protein